MPVPYAAISWNVRMDFDPRVIAVICAVLIFNTALRHLKLDLWQCFFSFCAFPSLFFSLLLGAMMKLTVDDKVFTKSALDRLVSSMLTEDSSGLMSYSYRTAVNTLHLTLVDNTTNEKSVALAEKIHAYLIKG